MANRPAEGRLSKVSGAASAACLQICGGGRTTGRLFPEYSPVDASERRGRLFETSEVLVANLWCLLVRWLTGPYRRSCVYLESTCCCGAFSRVQLCPYHALVQFSV